MYMEFNEKHTNCTVSYPYLIGNEVCDGGEYNTKACGWDRGDCFDINTNYPNCKVENPSYIGDGSCHNFDLYRLKNVAGMAETALNTMVKDKVFISLEGMAKRSNLTFCIKH